MRAFRDWWQWRMEVSIMAHWKVCTFHSSLHHCSWFIGCELILVLFQCCYVIHRRDKWRSQVYWKCRASASNTTCNQFLSSKRYCFRTPCLEIMNCLLKEFQMCHFWWQASFLFCFLLIIQTLVDNATICWSSPKSLQDDRPPPLLVSKPIVKVITVTYLIC